MHGWRTLWKLLRQGRAMDADLSEEVDGFFKEMVERFKQGGMATEEARRTARLKFGGPEQIKEEARDARSGAGVVRILRDVKFAARALRKNRAFAAVTILTLALGSAATTGVFSVVYAVLLRPLPYSEPDRLVEVFQSDRKDARQEFLLPDVERLREQSRSLSATAIFFKDSGISRVTLTGRGEPEPAQGAYVSANLFPLLSVAPWRGRVFTREEEAQNERVAVLSYRLWERRFASDPEVVGQPLEIDGSQFTVIGVMPEKFQFPAQDSQFWAPITTNRFWLDRPELDRPDRRTSTRGFYARWNTVARLKPGVSVERAQAEISSFAPRFEAREPMLNKGLGLTVVPLRAEVSGHTRLALLILLAAVTCLLLIACVNGAHLLLARGVGRGQEIAVRLALGASRGDLIHLLVTESVVLSLLAGCLGTALAVPVVRALVAFGPADIPRLEQAQINWQVLIFAVGVSLVTAILFGCLPAWTCSRSAPDQALKAGGRAASAAGKIQHARATLVIAELALTVILLSAAGLSIRSLLAVQKVDPGFNPGHVLTVRLRLPAGVRHPSLYDQALERMERVAGVRYAGAVSGLFEPSAADLGWQHAGEPPKVAAGRLRVWANWKSVRGDYFQAMGIALLRGRFFSARDGANAPLTAIIDQSMAQRYWPGEDAIGKQFRGQDARGRADDPLTVVGVVRDSRSHGREAGPTAHVYQPAAQCGKDDPTPDLVVRTAGDPVKLAGSIRAIVRSLDRAAIVSEVTTLEEQLNQEVSPRRFQTWLLGVFSALALILASIGIYGVMHYAVAQRTHEIGIRMALGAQPGGVLRMVVRQGMGMVATGLVVGLCGARWLSTFLGSMLFGVTPADPFTYAGVAALLTALSAAAITAPAWHAARIDPLRALRQD